MLLYRISILITFLLAFVFCENKDYYKILGVSRSASKSEIKSSYKNLARLYHPDKNRDPGSSDRFASINEAYEVLSDVSKRREYDAFGTVHNQQAHKRSHDVFQFDDLFNMFHQKMHDSQNVVDLNYYLYKSKYLPESRHTPLLIITRSRGCFSCTRLIPIWNRIADSISKYGVVVGKALLSEQENAMRDALNTYHSPTIISVVDGKLSYYYSNHVSEGEVIEFLLNSIRLGNPCRICYAPKLFSSTLATPLVRVFENKKDIFAEIQEFQSGWKLDSRPRAVIVLHSSKNTNQLRAFMAAFRAADHIATGIILLDNHDQVSRGSIQQFLDRFNLAYDRESLIIFKEDFYHPSYKLTSFQITRSQIDEAFWKNNRLAVPRISNAFRLVNLCPSDGLPPNNFFDDAYEFDTHSKDRSHENHKHVCLVLLLDSRRFKSSSDKKTLHQSWLNISKNLTENINSIVRGELKKMNSAFLANFYINPIYIFTDKQRYLLNEMFYNAEYASRKTFDKEEDVDLKDDENLAYRDNVGKFVLFWRRTSKKTVYHFLNPHGSYHPRNLVKDANQDENAFEKQFIDLHRDALRDSIIKAIGDWSDTVTLKGNGWLMADDLIIENLIVDEFQFGIWHRIKLRIGHLLNSSHEYISRFVTNPLGFFSSIFLIGFSLMFLQCLKAISGDSDGFGDCRKENKKGFEDTKQTFMPTGSSQPLRKVPILALNQGTYDGFVRNCKDPYYLVILCIMDTNKNSKLINQFQHYMTRYGSKKTVAVTLHLPTYASWVASLLRIITKLPVIVKKNDMNDADNDDLCIKLRPINCLGTVIVLNPARKYFFMYHRVMPSSQTIFDLSHENEENEMDSESCRKEDVENVTTAEEIRNQKKGVRLTHRKRHVFGKVFGFDSEDEGDLSNEEDTVQSASDINPVSGSIKECELLSHLPNWLDRLYEGTLRRMRVTDWPTNLDGGLS